MSSEMTLRQKVGQRIMTGLPGTSLDADFAAMVREYKISNVILFRRNIENRNQLAGLCRDIQKLVRAETGHGALIAIDQEGGTVTRLPADSVNIPGAMAIAAAGGPEKAYEAGRITGRELRALGVNFNLAPVLDVNSNPENPLIGVRSFGETPQAVTKYGLSMMRGLLDSGVLCAAKHFPGHGDADTDSHLKLPCVGKSLEELLETEVAPFQAAIRNGLPAVMSAHILFPRIEAEKIPATLSRTILTGLLKEKLGFRGLVMTDCLEMKSVQCGYGTVEGAVEAAAAGADLILISHSGALASQADLAIVNALQDGKLNPIESDASVGKILRLKETYAQDSGEGPGYGGLAESRRRARGMAAAAITPVRLPEEGLPPLGKHPCFIGSPLFRTTQVTDPDDNSEFSRRLAKRLGGCAEVTPKDPSDEEIEALAARAPGYSCVVVAVDYGRLHPGQLKLAERLARTGVPTVAAVLRDPYDLRRLPPELPALAVYDYSADALDALAEVLAGDRRACGRLPIAL